MKRCFLCTLAHVKKRKHNPLLMGIMVSTLALGTACGAVAQPENGVLQESESSEFVQNTSMPEETSQMEDVSIPEPHEVYDTEMVFLVNGCSLTLHTDGSYEMVDYIDCSSIDELEGTYYIRDNHLFLESTHKKTRMTFEKDGDNWVFLASKSSGYDERDDWFRDKERWWPDNEPEVSIPTYEDLDGQVYIPAYIRDITENSITVDVVEFIDRRNTERINELGLTEYDMVAGYYMVNSSIQTREWKLDEQTTFSIADWKGYFRNGEPGEYVTSDMNEVVEYINKYHMHYPAEPFFFQVEDGVVKFVLEKWFP